MGCALGMLTPGARHLLQATHRTTPQTRHVQTGSRGIRNPTSAYTGKGSAGIKSQTRTSPAHPDHSTSATRGERMRRDQESNKIRALERDHQGSGIQRTQHKHIQKAHPMCNFPTLKPRNLLDGLRAASKLQGSLYVELRNCVARLSSWCTASYLSH